jgi:purine-binding chemotaxis protein CheW
MAIMQKFMEQEEIQVIAFRLGKEEYAVSITCVQEIIMPQEKTKIPRSPEFVEGVINLRGNIIPVIDGRKRFGLELTGNTQETRIMVLELEKSTVGLTVDAVSEVIHLQTKNIQPSPVNSDDSNDFILGIGKYKDRLIILLDPDNFLNIHEIESIKNITKVAENIKDVTTIASSAAKLK